MTFTYFGHSCFQFEISGFRILFDPFISPNPLAQHVNISEIQPHYIIVSHGHGDHVADLIRFAQQSEATVISNYEISEWVKAQGISRVIGMNTGGKYTLPFGTVRLTHAVHSSVLPDGKYGGHPNGVLLHSDEGNIFYAGDTALHMDLQLIPHWAPQLDIALLPVGDHFTMGIEDAIVAAQWVKAKKIIPVHYNSFPPIQIDTTFALQQFEQAEIPFSFYEIGKPIVL